MTNLRRICFAVYLSGLCFLASQTDLRAEDRIPLPIEDALKTNSFGETSPLSLSPDGKQLAFMTRENEKIRSTSSDEREAYIRTGIHTRSRAGNIWIADLDSKGIKNLTGNVGSNWDPSWSPDGRYLAFLSDRDGSGQARLWVWDSLKNEIRKVCEANVRGWLVFNRLKWTPDSRKILITTVPQRLSIEKYYEEIQGSGAGGKSEASIAERTGPIVYKSGSMTTEESEASSVNLRGVYLHDLTLVDVSTGLGTTIATGRLIKWFAPSPDGHRVAYATMKAFHRKQQSDLVAVDLATMREQTLVSEARFDAFSWSPDSKAIAYGAYHGDNVAYDYFTVAIEGGLPRRVSSLSQVSSNWRGSGNPMWDATAENFYFLHDGAFWRTSVTEGKSVELARIPNKTMRFRIWHGEQTIWSSDGGRSTVVVAYDEERKQDGFYKVDLRTGQTTELLERGECYSCKWGMDFNGYVAAAENGRIAYIAEDGQRAPDLWVSDGGFLGPEQITHLNPQFERYKMGTARIIEWLSGDGARLHGALLLPSDYREGKKYPLIVWSYPGSLWSHYYDSFGFGEFPGPFNVQLLATRGYAVLLADAPWNKDDQSMSLAKTVLPGVNRVIELGIADPDRIGLMGHSAGGYSTLSLITQTNRFKAAVEAAGYGDLIGSYGMMRADGSSSLYMRVETLVGQGGPWQDPVSYVENSPVFRFHRVSTPLLIIHGSQDGDVASFLADEVFVDLRRLGKEAEYARYENEAHVPRDWSYAHQFDVANRVITWFDQHLQTKSQ